MKNAARMPRTAGLRTLSELTSELTKAGLNPSRIKERAEVLAKVAGAKRKRQQEEEDAEMDVDGGSDGEEDGEGDWMDVDGEEGGVPSKRVKTNSGEVVAKGRQPRSQRQLAGMRDEAVSIAFAHVSGSVMLTAVVHLTFTASVKSYQTAESRTERTQYARQGRRGRPRNQGQDGMLPVLCRRHRYNPFYYSQSICSLASGKAARRTAGKILLLLLLYHYALCRCNYYGIIFIFTLKR